MPEVSDSPALNRDALRFRPVLALPAKTSPAIPRPGSRVDDRGAPARVVSSRSGARPRNALRLSTGLFTCGQPLWMDRCLGRCVTPDDPVLRSSADGEYAALDVGGLKSGKFAAAGACVGGDPDQQRVLLSLKQVEHTLPGVWLFSQPGAGLVHRLVRGGDQLADLFRAEVEAGLRARGCVHALQRVDVDQLVLAGPCDGRVQHPESGQHNRRCIACVEPTGDRAFNGVVGHPVQTRPDSRSRQIQFGGRRPAASDKPLFGTS